MPYSLDHNAAGDRGNLERCRATLNSFLIVLPPGEPSVIFLGTEGSAFSVWRSRLTARRSRTKTRSCRKSSAGISQRWDDHAVRCKLSLRQARQPFACWRIDVTDGKPAPSPHPPTLLVRSPDWPAGLLLCVCQRSFSSPLRLRVAKSRLVAVKRFPEQAAGSSIDTM